MSYISVYIHAVWAVKYRQALLTPEVMELARDRMHALLTDRGCQPIITNGDDDHIHTLFGWSCREDIGTTMKAVKAGSSLVVNEAFFNRDAPFRWQGGFGAFGVGRRQLSIVSDYIRRQREIHAARRTFAEEYLQMQDEGDCVARRRHHFDGLIDHPHHRG